MPTRTSLRVEEPEQTTDGSHLPVRRDDLGRHLPGIEPERRLNDWGRSERIEGLLDRTLVDFFYRYWFRCEVEGIENVPSTGGALLVSNHGGALPPDAAMIAKAIKEEHAHPRPVNITVEHFFKGYPGFSMLVSKIGCVPAHPANVHRLLYDEEQLVLVFPRAARPPRSSTRTAIGSAASAAAVRGGGDARPGAHRAGVRGGGGGVGARLRPAQADAAPDRAPLLPDHAHVPALGLLGMIGYLPAKFKIRFLEPIHFEEEGMHEDKALVQTVAHDVRARIQENLLDMLERKSVWFG
jgi:1-acyl-sn-glycerol-3-phosphate acyltransferase